METKTTVCFEEVAKNTASHIENLSKFGFVLAVFSHSDKARFSFEREALVTWDHTYLAS